MIFGKNKNHEISEKIRYHFSFNELHFSDKLDRISLNCHSYGQVLWILMKKRVRDFFSLIFFSFSKKGIDELILTA